MRAAFLSLCAILFILSCSERKDARIHLDGKNDIQLDFAQTTDKAFCNADSIIPSDCSGGDFYFTKKGNVFYTFFCMGDDSVSYSVGKYVITDSLVTCVFNREYSFYNGEYGQAKDGKSIDPNVGALKDAKEFTIRLIKTNCELHPYYFIDRNEIYVLRKRPTEGSIDFISAIKEIKILSDM